MKRPGFIRSMIADAIALLAICAMTFLILLL